MILRKTKLPYLFFLPVIMLVLVFNFIPFLDTLILSFKNTKLILPEERFAGLDNYQAILTHSRFLVLAFSYPFVYLCLDIPGSNSGFMSGTHDEPAIAR